VTASVPPGEQACASRPALRPVSQEAIDRHTMLAATYIGHMRRKERAASSALIARMVADPEVDPWRMVIALGAVAAQVLNGAQRPPRRR
jgi:hypothetical protein